MFPTDAPLPNCLHAHGTLLRASRCKILTSWTRVFTWRNYVVMGGFRGERAAPPPPPSSGNHSEKGKILLFANCKIKPFAFSEYRKCHFQRLDLCSKFSGGHASGSPYSTARASPVDPPPPPPPRLFQNPGSAPGSYFIIVTFLKIYMHIDLFGINYKCFKYNLYQSQPKIINKWKIGGLLIIKFILNIQKCTYAPGTGYTNTVLLIDHNTPICLYLPLYFQIGLILLTFFLGGGGGSQCWPSVVAYHAGYLLYQVR